MNMPSACAKRLAICCVLFAGALMVNAQDAPDESQDASRAAFLSLSEEKKQEFRNFIRQLVKEQPELSREERGTIILGALEQLASGNSLGEIKASDAKPETVTLWEKGKMPGPAPMVEGEERDTSTEDSKKIAGRPLIRLSHVSEPEITIYRPAEFFAKDAAVIVCPGGGFYILAQDLEGTEVAEWLVRQGITAVVLKYRVPTAGHGEELVPAYENDEFKIPKKALGPVIDAQRAIQIIRSRADELKIDSEKIGILGFSAGGVTAALAANAKGMAVFDQSEIENPFSPAPNFMLLIYPGGLADAETGNLHPFAEPNSGTPPAFLVHAADDRVTCLSSVALFSAMKLKNIPAELHVYETGGHGYGLRESEGAVTRWPKLAEQWLQNRNFKRTHESVEKAGNE